ncbi:hypothetical protein [Pseudomonas protegens]|uniref:hypothetical protein n=1 Tax=Pseudomonas protegens TaxID=380021 RepID=UPI00387DCE5C
MNNPPSSSRRIATVSQGAQLGGLIVDAGGLDRQGLPPLSMMPLWLFRAPPRPKFDLLAGDLPVVATVVEMAAANFDKALGVEATVAVIEIAGGDQRIAALRGNPPAVVVGCQPGP